MLQGRCTWPECCGLGLWSLWTTSSCPSILCAQQQAIGQCCFAHNMNAVACTSLTETTTPRPQHSAHLQDSQRHAAAFLASCIYNHFEVLLGGTTTTLLEVEVLHRSEDGIRPPPRSVRFLPPVCLIEQSTEVACSLSLLRLLSRVA